MAAFTTTKNWYLLSVSSKSNFSMLGQPLLSTSLQSAVYFEPTNNQSTYQQFQIYQYNTTNYIFRTAAAGPRGYMTLINNGDGSYGAPQYGGHFSRR
ncbi:uncharacterized protein PAC_12741 [Phialocephala subalpina]|uniref:Ricin B lectin domain-containing protein n=1 Tax=Phialocephala subalpina TaxID=576137 RepID=A0A1L7XCT9_9HELO|nr:uncharacterized protein PAC_12741 [Phialocephala subalpina]